MESGTVLAVISIVGTASYAFWNHYSKKAIEHRFNKSLQKHQSDISKDLKLLQGEIDQNLAAVNSELQHNLKKFELSYSNDLQQKLSLHTKRSEYVFDFHKECSQILLEIFEHIGRLYAAAAKEGNGSKAVIWGNLIQQKNTLLNKSALLFVYFDAKTVRTFRMNLSRLGSSSTYVVKGAEDWESGILLALFSVASCFAALKYFTGAIMVDEVDQEALNICEGLGLSDNEVIQALTLNKKLRDRPAAEA